MTASRADDQAADTVVFLQQAAHRGSPVLIPGAWEARAGAQAGGSGETPSVPAPAAAAVSDSERRELVRRPH